MLIHISRKSTAAEMKTNSCLYLAICGILLIASCASSDRCDHVQDENKESCRALVKRWLLLKDEFFQQCCQNATEIECNVCDKTAKSKASAKIKAEMQNMKDANESIKSSDDDISAIMPTIIEDRISLGTNRRHNVFRNPPRRNRVTQN